MKKLTRLSLILPTLLLAHSLQGNLIFSEYFHEDEFAGNDTNLANGTNWAGGTNQMRFVDTVNLSFTNAGYSDTGNPGTGAARTNASDANGRGSWTTVSATALSGEFWFSGLHQRNVITTTDSYSIFNLGTANSIDPTNASFNTSTSFGLHNEGSTLRPFIATGNAGTWTAPTTGSAVADTTYLILARGNTTTSTLDVWFFEESDTVPLTVADLPSPTLTTSSAELSNVTTLWIGKRGGTGGTTYFDALRLSDAAGDSGFQAVTAIPEPSTYAAIFGLFAIGLIAWRRRRQKN